jgi:hypothetical protein
MGIGGGDYPHLNHACYQDFPHTIPGQCDVNTSPIMQSGTAFRHAEMLPNMFALPCSIHLNYFLAWRQTKEIVGIFNMTQNYGLKFDVSGRVNSIALTTVVD